MAEKDTKAMAALRAHAKKPAKQAHGKAFKKGGPTSEDRMKMGKNLSRVANQKSG